MSHVKIWRRDFCRQISKCKKRKEVEEKEPQQEEDGGRGKASAKGRGDMYSKRVGRRIQQEHRG